MPNHETYPTPDNNPRDWIDDEIAELYEQADADDKRADETTNMRHAHLYRVSAAAAREYAAELEEKCPPKSQPSPSSSPPS